MGMLVRLTNLETILVFEGVDALGLLRLMKICKTRFKNNCVNGLLIMR